MRAVLLAVILFPVLAAPQRASCAQEALPDAAALAHLAEKAHAADPREQPVLYARLVRGRVALADRALTEGDDAAAEEALHAIETDTASLDAAIGDRTRNLHDAEILMRESAFHLRADLHAAAAEQREAIAGALRAVDAAEDKLMQAVFQH